MAPFDSIYVPADDAWTIKGNILYIIIIMSLELPLPELIQYFGMLLRGSL